MVLICIPLMISDVEHHLLVGHWFIFFENCLFSCPFLFLNWVLFVVVGL